MRVVYKDFYDNDFKFSGEEAFSYGFGGKGKISEDSKFNDYGAPFQLNDVVGVYMVSHLFHRGDL